MSSSEPEAALDRDVFLLFRATADENPDKALCLAQETPEGWTPTEDDANAGRKSKSSKSKVRSKASKDPKEQASEGVPGDHPWRRNRAEGASPQQHHRQPHDDAHGSPPSSGPGPSPQPPWRKSPSPTDLGASPVLSEREMAASSHASPGPVEIEVTMEEGDAAGSAEPFASLAAASEETAATAAAPDAQPDQEDDADKQAAEGGADAGEDVAEKTAQQWNNDEFWKGGGDKWKKDVVLPSDTVVGPLPPPPLHTLAGTWFDSLGNMIQVPTWPPVAWFTGANGTTQHELTLDKWGRLWCGNGVLHQVGYSGGPLAQDMPASHLSWRTTSWRVSTWERVPGMPAGATEEEQAQHKGGKKKQSGKGGGKSSGKGGKGGGKGKDRQDGAPAKPALPKLGDFLSFPALGEEKKEGKKTKS